MMEVRTVNPVASATSRKATTAAESPRPKGDGPAPTGDLRRDITGPLAQKLLEASGVKPAEINRFRVQLDIDDDTGRVVAEVRNKESGELVAEVPSRTLLRQAAMLRDVLGTILDKPV